MPMNHSLLRATLGLSTLTLGACLALGCTVAPDAGKGSSGGSSSGGGGSSSGGSSSGGGATCHPANGCLGGSITPMTAGCGGTAKYFTGTFKNSCSKSVRCTICQPGGVDCQDWTFSPGESRGGWTTFLWCNSAGNSLQWTCTDAADPSSCR